MRILKPCNPYLFYALLLILGVLVFLAEDLVAQAAPLDRVMTMTGDTGGGQPLTIDQGSTSLWQRLLKLRPTASALHTTAHPDDEHAGMLTYLSRGLGARTALLPRRAEEVSEQDAPVTVLDPAHLVFHVPNRITPADFDDWVEQRGSKFFAEWNPAYTPLIETHDNGQAPQRGAWLTARYGAGYYTYFALAIHRQLPYAVSGAYRIFANLLSMGRGGG